MKNNYSKILFTILSMVMLICVFVLGANAAVAEGTTDTGFAWTITGDATNGYILTISDTEASKELDTFSFTVDGNAPNASTNTNSFPWAAYKHNIVEIVYKANASTWKSGVFADHKAIQKVTMPSTVTAWGGRIFSYAPNLKTIAVEGEDLGENTLNFKYLTRIFDDVNYTAQFEGCFSTEIDYKVYLSEKMTFTSNSNIWGFGTQNWGKVSSSNPSRLDAGDIFYIPEGYADLADLNDIASTYGFTVEYYPKAESAMEMYGYQVRTEGYNGLRGIFNFNENAKNEGFSLVEYGAILAADANRGTDDANIKLVYNEATGEYEPTVERIVKKAIKQNGALVEGAKTLKKLNGQAVGDIKGYGEGYTWFATTLVNFSHSYNSDVYMCGYEIWKNELTDEISIIYTDYEIAEYESTSIYDASVALMADGFTNDLENNPVGQVVKAAGAVTLTSSDATLPTGAESLVAENIEMMGYASGAFTAGTTYYSLYSMPDGNYLAYISGEGNLTSAALKNTYASDFAGETRPVPTLLEATYNKITHMVIGEGIVDLSSFKEMKKLVSIIYPESLKTIAKAGAYNVFQYCDVLEKIVPVGTLTDEKIFEFGNIVFNDNNLFQWSFQGCKAVEYIHIGGYRAGSDIFYGCSSLKAIWIGNAERPADGIADFRNCGATELKMGSFTGTSGLNTLLLSDTFTTLVKSDWGFSIKTVYQATANENVKTFCEGGDPKATATYTQTLPQ